MGTYSWRSLWRKPIKAKASRGLYLWFSVNDSSLSCTKRKLSQPLHLTTKICRQCVIQVRACFEENSNTLVLTLILTLLGSSYPIIHTDNTLSSIPSCQFQKDNLNVSVHLPLGKNYIFQLLQNIYIYIFIDALAASNVYYHSHKTMVLCQRDAVVSIALNSDRIISDQLCHMSHTINITPWPFSHWALQTGRAMAFLANASNVSIFGGNFVNNDTNKIERGKHIFVHCHF